LGIDYIALYFNANNIGYAKEGNGNGKVEVRPVEDLSIGIHADYTNSFKGNGRMHLTVDVDHHLYMTVKGQKGWKTWDEDSENENGGTMPENNLQLRSSLSLRF
jgi:hypothetical protein